MTLWHAELAWLGEVRERVLLEVEDDRLVSVTSGVEAPPGVRRLSGLVLPGLVNVHSHAFQRALRGRSEPPHASQEGDFWTWREQMYRLAAALDPQNLFELARATYVEMALAGITAVGEFHYLHHRPGGEPYADPNQTGRALAAAAEAAGLRITLLDTCYLRGGLDGRPLEGAQLRFGDHSAAAWAERVNALGDGPRLRVGAAIHSVRAVDEPSMAAVARWAAERRTPLHVHLSEQPAENRDCRAATGLTPTALLERAGVLGPRTTAVHATHLERRDIEMLGATGTSVCLCPTTERELADGVGPAAALAAAGSPLCVGSDSQAVIDLFEEARAIELDQRLVSGRRGHHSPEALLEAMTESGAAALGWDAGRLEPGRLADFVALDLTGFRLAGWEVDDLARQAVYAATAADVTDVVVGGREIVSAGRHSLQPDAGRSLHAAVRRVLDLLPPT
ncbi:MAG: formimidoylglutamate deiminase [Candidatus Nephthysia bennettiae]|nr:MAG: formimidoylglutamate deiminase [Candidatus Dormibacteraeota bacterium]